MAFVAVVFHSGFGDTAIQAEAVASGARSVSGSSCELFDVGSDVHSKVQKLAVADAIIFGSPTYMGSVSAPFKAFMDATSSVWEGRLWKDKLAGGFTNAANHCGDKAAVLVQLSIFAAQHGMLWVSMGAVARKPWRGAPINALGSSMGAMAVVDESQFGDAAFSTSDLLTAEYLGRRIALLASSSLQSGEGPSE